ncbi:hypothetical protein JCM11251_000016 [Rhodosporidiobolus azoricus]
MPVTTRRSARSTMNPQSYQFFAPQASSKSAFDEAAADLTAFLDLSSFNAPAGENAPLAVGHDFSSFTHDFKAPAPASTTALRPVDDSLLDSPLGLELSPASSYLSSTNGSPFDFAGSVADFTSPLLSSYGSPLVDTLGGCSVSDNLPSLFAPTSFAMDATATPLWAPQDIVTTPAAVSMPMAMEDVKPVISPVLTRLDTSSSLLFDIPTSAGPASAAVPPPFSMDQLPSIPVTPVVEDTPSAPASTKRKTVAQLKKEAAALVEEKAFKKDSFRGFRNTKKPMIDYDAPTLPKNYLTESATSRKRGASSTPAPSGPSSSGSGSSSNKRARTASSSAGTPAPAPVDLPATAPEPLAAEDLDEDQLSAIELKRRQNTLAARRSRMRKMEHLKGLNDEIERLRMLNEELQRENQRLRDKCGESQAQALSSGLDELLISSVLKADLKGAGAATTVQGGKEPLSIQSTSVNFRRFVQKSGPIFVAQDAVEAVLRWEDPLKTMFFASAWGFLCYWPSLALFIPNLVLLSILLTTYSARKAAGPPPESQEGPTGLASAPPSEGSVDYFANLQNIQITMGRVADLTDNLRLLVPYLTWQNERVSRALLHLAVISSFLLALAAPYIPYKLVFFLLGESAFLAGHPLVRSLASNALPHLDAQRKKRSQLVRRLLEDDALADEDLEMEVVEAQRLEIEARAPPGPEGTWTEEVTIGGECPSGFRWLGEWEDAAPADGTVDADGWTYIHLDGTRTSTPSVPGEKGPVFAQSRRRRLTRRAIKNPFL